MKMRRKDREVTDIEEIKSIIESCKVCHLAMVDDGTPYVIPLNYGYRITSQTLTLYFHSAQVGRKIDILHKNNTVCFEMCLEGEPIYAAQTPCNSGYYFSSVHGFGNVEFITDVSEKCNALSLLMKQQANISAAFTQEQANSVCVYKVISNDFTGKIKQKPV
jgi:uncharacterized protein